MKKILILFLAYLILTGFGWDVNRWGLSEYGSGRWDSGVDATATYWNTPMTDRWNTPMTALWNTTMDTEIP